MKTWLWGDNSVNIQGLWFLCTTFPLTALPLFHIYVSLYVPSFISIPSVLLKIWPGQASIMKNKWLRGDNSVKIQSRIMVLVHCPSSHCHLSINQVSKSIPFVLSKIWLGQASIMKNKWLWGDN